MSTNYRALCAEMLSGWQEGRDIAGPMNRARAALKAEPEGEGPSCADLLPAEPPNISTTMAMQYRSAWREGVEDGWNEARTILAGLKRTSTPQAPEPGELGELVELLKLAGRWATSTGVHLNRFAALFAALFDQQATELAALREVPVALSEWEDAFMGGVCAALLQNTAIHGGPGST